MKAYEKSSINIWVWLKIKQAGLRRFWSMSPLTRATHFGIPGFLSHIHISSTAGPEGKLVAILRLPLGPPAARIVSMGKRSAGSQDTADSCPYGTPVQTAQVDQADGNEYGSLGMASGF